MLLGQSKVEKTKSTLKSGAFGAPMRIAKKGLASDPYSKKCRICKTGITAVYNYCQKCAYAKGICSICGVKMFDVKQYKMTDI
jgi:hypothetical protein